MRAWVYYRVRAKDPSQVVELIEHYSSIIRRPDNGHSFSFVICNIFQYRFGNDPKVSFSDSYKKHQQKKWFQAFNIELKYFFLIKKLRITQLFSKVYHLLGSEHEPLLNELKNDYHHVNQREPERAFFRMAETVLKPIVREKWEIKKSIENQCFSDFWREITSEWRSFKRHTSSFSFPFIRPGVDIYKSFAYDIGKEEDPIWYSNVYYIY